NVSYDQSTVLSAVLTDEDKQAIAEGKTIFVVLSVKSAASVPETDKTAAAAAVSDGQKIEFFLDVSLSKSVDGTSSALTSTSGPVPVTVTIPNYNSSNEYSVIRVHDGVAEVIKSTTNGNKITFYSDKFSTFALVSKAASTGSGKTVKIDTGDAATLDSSWSKYVSVDAAKFADLNAGDTIEIAVSAGASGETQIKLMDGSWAVLPSFDAIDNEWNVVTVAGDAKSFSLTLAQADVDALKASGMIISGQNIVIGTGSSSGGNEEKPETPTVNYYSISTDRFSAVSTNSAAAGTLVGVKTVFGYTANVYSGGKLIAAITDSGSFVMPASNVTIISVVNGNYGLLLSAKPVSYIYAYDADMNKITTASTRKSKVDGQITVKLGSEYAGRTVTLYSGRKNTSDKITSEEADSNGNVTFTVDLGKNYTAVVE
ncbi:MAG: hypothetical protein ACI4XF_03895, partial [Oscillospiraceae bacterium]